ncbi:MAG: thymidylate kinase [Candidatus Methanoperedens sp.]
MSKKPMFICITGIDGVGKTTHVNLILEHLRNKGIKCEYKWLRFHHLVSLPLLAFCRLAGYTRVSTLGGRQKCSYHEFYRSRFISAVYPWILLADTVLFTTLKVYIPMFFGTSIVCDRFIYDTLIDVTVATKDHEIYNKTVCKLFLNLIPKDARFIMLSLEKSIVLSRREELIDDLTFDARYELYQEFADHFGIRVIDNSNLVVDVNKIIISGLDV